jgi:hypothetical protein
MARLLSKARQLLLEGDSYGPDFSMAQLPEPERASRMRDADYQLCRVQGTNLRRIPIHMTEANPSQLAHPVRR